jgi:hypothetical protein
LYGKNSIPQGSYILIEDILDVAKTEFGLTAVQHLMHVIKEEDNRAKVSVVALKSLISEADNIFETMADLEDNHDKAALEAYDG